MSPVMRPKSFGTFEKRAPGPKKHMLMTVKTCEAHGPEQASNHILILLLIWELAVSVEIIPGHTSYGHYL